MFPSEETQNRVAILEFVKMTRNDVVTRIRANSHELQRLGVSALRLFGSFSRDAARDDSDVDLLVTFDGPPTFDRYMALKHVLEDALGRRVDLVPEAALRPELRSGILSEAMRVA